MQAAAAAVSVTALGRIPAAEAVSKPDYTWLLPRASFDDLNILKPKLCQSAFNNGNTWFSTIYNGSGSEPQNPIPQGYSGMAVLKFQSYDYTDSNGVEWGLSQVIDSLPTWVDAVQYDSESWNGPVPLLTPHVEQGAWIYNPDVGLSYAEEFCALAHSHSKKVVLTPSNDLCNNTPNPAYPNDAPQYPLNPDEKDYEAYVRYNFASASQWLNAGDIYEYQAQRLEKMSETNHPAPYLYKHITTEVAGQIQKSGVIFLAGIGTSQDWDGATGEQLYKAASSVTSVADGYWPNLTKSSKQTAPMISMLEKMGYTDS
jgi:hypothetical protein